MNDILYLDTPSVAAVLADLPVVDAIARAQRDHARGTVVLPEEAYLRWDHTEGWARSLCLPAALGTPATVAGTKIINSCLGNPAKGLPRAGGLLALYDVETAHIRTLMAAAELSATRTAAVSALGALHLAPAPVTDVAIFGAGPIGRTHARVLARTLPEPPRTIRLYDLDAARCAEAARVLAAELGPVRVRAAASPAEALDGASLVVAATTTDRPYLDLHDVPAGSLTVNVGLDDCAEGLLMGADVLVVDSRQLVAADHRRLLGRLIADGKVTRHPVPDIPPNTPPAARAVDAEIGELVAGQRKLTLPPRGRVVFNPFGMAVNDVALGSVIDREARRRGLGIRLPS
ncbi:ornithine cyclodeaminase [Streptomyces sp. NPDC059009]|uniref:ornithine cyclodeaminase n=1 Tax=Streptomyces sp. NPDC059009 TaxID=3346694 RepID=UPI0036B964AA